MKKNFILTAIAAVFFNSYNAQIGVNTGLPKATFDVVGEPSVTAKLDGIIAPRITGDLLRAKTYTTDQNGAIVYVTTADSAPSGQTIDVISEGYYYYSFPSNQWIKMGPGTQTNDWHNTGNSDAEISTVTETLGSAPASSNYIGTKGSGDDLVLASGGASRAVLDVTGTLKGGGTDGNSYWMWGSQNTAAKASAALTFNNAIIGGYKNALTNSNVNPATGTAATVILGKENTVNFNGIAIGYSNNVTTGAIVIGNKNANGAGASIFGLSNSTGGNNIMVLGNSFKSTPYTTIVSGSGTSSGTTVYANNYHFFQNTDSAGSIVMAKMGINVVPVATQEADIKVSKAVQFVNDTTLNCDATTEGSIRYNATSTVGNFQGCKRLTSTTFGWIGL